GSVFEPRTADLPREELRAGALVMGRRRPPHFTDPKSPDFQAWAMYDEWDAKSLAQLIAGAIYPSGAIEFRGANAENSLWDVFVGPDRVGDVRRVTLDAPVWAPPAYGIEITFGVMDASQVAPPGESAYRPAARPVASVVRYQPLPTTPASEFDLA